MAVVTKDYRSWLGDGEGSEDLSFPVEDLGAIKAPRKIKDVKQRKTSLLVK